MTFAQAFSLEGQNVLVTGGAGTLGRGMAACLLSAGAHVILTDISAENLETAQRELGGNTDIIVHDITDTSGAEDFAARARSDFGPVSILINNAGRTIKKPIADMTVPEFEQVMNIHVTGAYALSRAFLPQIAAHGNGSMVFTASMSSFLGVPQIAGYSAAKAAYVGLIRALSTELLPQGVRVNGVAPGWVDTDLFRTATRSDPARLEKIMGRIPMNTLGTPEDIGWAVAYLCSPAARYVSGHILVVDGGALHAF